jgi:D-alanyl-D-alanine carboxypeptidase (penicillin-binding protein 5/6)
MKLGKRLVSFVLCAAMLFGVPWKQACALSDEEISAPSALLMEAESGKVLYEKNSREVRVCASITKVMTLLLVMEALDSGKISLQDTIAASEHAASMGGSDIWLAPGEIMSVDDLIKATVVASANDAAVALAEHISGTEDAFVEEMNRKAKELGMTDTVFKNCNGLDEDGHVTTAYDVALMSRELIKHKKIFEYTSIWMDTLRGGKTQLVNTNKLLKSYQGITGLKTGTTGQAGSCISATAERDGLSLIAVTLGSATGKERFSAASTLLDYGFANYTLHKPEVPQEALSPVPVTNGMRREVATQCEAGGNVLVAKGKESEITSRVEMTEGVEAPVEKGQQLGKIVYQLGDQTLAEYPVVAAEPVEKISFFAVFAMMFQQLFAR